MPNPRAGETQEEFIAQFMESPEANRDFPDQKQRAAVAYKKWRSDNGRPVVNDDDEDLKEYLLKVMGQPAAKPKDEERQNQRGQAGKLMPMRFILPGLVAYNDVGTVLVGKEALDKILNSFVGKPIFNGHQDVSNADFTTGRAKGIVAGNLRFNASDGWYWGDVLVWDDETLKNIQNGYTLSCAYDVTEWGSGGLHNNIPYDREVLNGEYTHLAIVPNPRYEGVRIIYNQGGHMKLKFWPFSKDQKPEAQPSEVELTNALVTVGEAEVPLEKIIEGFKAEEKRKADELANAKTKLSDDDTVDVDGKKVAVKDLKAGFAASLKNAEDEDKKRKEDEERKNAEEKEKEEKAKKEEEERKNAEEHEKGEHEEKERENCLKCAKEKERKNSQHFTDLKNAHHDREGNFKEPELKSQADRVAEGSKRYGQKQ